MTLVVREWTARVPEHAVYPQQPHDMYLCLSAYPAGFAMPVHPPLASVEQD
jgi:hypothetical protein